MKWPRAGLVSLSTSLSPSGCTVGCPGASLGRRSDSEDGSEKPRLRRGKAYPQRQGQCPARTGRSIHIFRRNGWFCGPSQPRGLPLGLVMCAMGRRGRGPGGVKHRGVVSAAEGLAAEESRACAPTRWAWAHLVAVTDLDPVLQKGRVKD